MADPLSITASIITAATLAYSSSKTLYQTISGIHEAPATFAHLETDLQALYETINALQQQLEQINPSAIFSEPQKSFLREVKPTLTACQSACDTFKNKIDKLMRHSTDSHFSLRDKLKLQFKEKEIGAFQAQLGSYKSTLVIALEFSTLKTASENLDATKRLETKIEDVTARLTGQMQGLQIGLQAIFDASAESQDAAEAESHPQFAEAQRLELRHAIDAIEQQTVALSHCYRACMAAFQETTKATGHEFKLVKASNQAYLLLGDVGDVKGGALLHKYNDITVDGAKLIAGNLDGRYLKDFFK